jgi:chaperonin GroES
MLVKEGDTVLLPEYGGHKITLGDEKEYFLYRDDDILGVLSDKQ